MRWKIEAASRHAGIAGHALAQDEGRRLLVTTSCQVAGPRQFRYEIHLASNRDPESRTVYFDVRSPFDVAPPALCDAALLIALFPALHHGGELRIEGPVSRTLLRNVLELQGAWMRARPDLYRPFRLAAAEVVDAAPVNAKAILPFTAGPDSMLTLCRHTDPARPLGEATEEIAATLFLPGFAPRPDRRDEYPAATEAVRQVAALRGLPLAVAETNFCDVVRDMPWSHGTLLAGSLTLFSSRFGRGLIGASVPYIHPTYTFFGSMAWIDPMYSSGCMAIRDDGTELLRVEKIAAVRRYTDMLDHLIVCFEVRGLTGNCSRCEKCLRTMLGFLALGAPLPKAFAQDIAMEKIGKRLGLLSALSFARNTLLAARALGTHHPALTRLRSRYRVKWTKYVLRRFLTHALTWVDLLRRDAQIPPWLVARRARRSQGAERGPWYRPR